MGIYVYLLLCIFVGVPCVMKILPQEGAIYCEIALEFIYTYSILKSYLKGCVLHYLHIIIIGASSIQTNVNITK